MLKDKLRILHLEDLPSDAALVERELKKGGIIFEKIVVDTERGFLKALSEFKPDIILSDHSLPSFNSIEALKIIKASGINIPFILITSTVSEEFAVRILKLGANDYVLKDNMNRLPSAIMQVMDIYENKAAKIKAEEELKSTNERLLFHLENSPLAYIEWDNKLHVSAWSKQAENIFGWTMKEFNDQQFTGYDLIYKDHDEQQVSKIVENLLSGKNKRNTITNRNYTKSGEIIWCEWFNSVLKDAEGNVKTIMSLVQDITVRKKAEELLAKNELRFREFFETAPEALFVLDPGSRTFIDYNDNALKLLKCTREELLGKSPTAFCPEYQANGQKSIDKIMEMDADALAGNQPIFDFIMRDTKGNDIPCEVRLNVLTNSDKPLIRASLLDITQRVTLEKKLTEEQVKSQVEITDAAILAQEQERAFLGQELHDNINQLLATSKLYLDFAVSSEVTRKDMLATARGYILNAMEEIRQLSKSLIAPSLGEMTLKDAIEDIISNIRLVHNMNFEYDWQLAEEGEMSSKLKLTVFRIVQEQLNNILKHAHAKTVWIKLRKTKGMLELSVRDDGTGFDITAKRKGVGLKNILSRASLFNGNLIVKSKPGKGTEINVKFDMGFNNEA